MTHVVRPPERSVGVLPPARARLRALVERRFAASVEVPTRFFDAHADLVSRAARVMASRFRAGGRLLVFGEDAAASDAEHVAVEFVHPVLVGKRALPALSLAGGDAARRLEILGRERDVALGIVHPGRGAGTHAALARARAIGMLTIALVPQDESVASADHVLPVPSSDPMLVQEVQETIYHVLFELVHVFLEHGGGA